MPPRIPDPKMNPEGERSHGIVFNDADGHLYIYKKDDKNKGEEETITESRFFTAGTNVQLGLKFPGFLIKIKDPDVGDQLYENAKYKKGFIDESQNSAIFEHFQLIGNQLYNLIQSNSELSKHVELVATDWNKIPPNDKKEDPGTPVIVDFYESLNLIAVPEEKINRGLNKEAKRLLKSNN